MKRAIYLLILTVATIACVIIGVSAHIGGFQIGGIGSKELISDDSALGMFDTIHLTANVMELTVKPGEDYGIEYSCTEGLVPTYEVKDGELIVEQEKDMTLFGNNRCSVTITIPEEKALDQVFMDIDVGDVTVENMEIVSFTLEADVGDLNIKNVNSKDMTFTCDTGDIEADNVTFTNLDIQTDVGDVDVRSAVNLDEYSFEMRCDVGEITINGDDSGNEHNVKGSAGTVTIQSDVGDVDVNY